MSSDYLKYANPRKRFSNSSVVDRRARSLLYKEGQVRLFFNGRKIMGPVKLRLPTFFFAPEDVEGGWYSNDRGFFTPERVWWCELVYEDRVTRIGEYSLGSKLTEMEAIAWAASL